MTTSANSPFATRCAKLAARLAELELDALLISSLPNIGYLSGFSGSTAWALVTPTERYFITDGRYTVQVQQEVDPGFTPVDNTNLKLLEDVLPGISGSGAWKRIGFEAGHTAHTTSAKFLSSAQWQFIPTEGWVEDLRMIKDEQEIELIRAAILLNERVFTETLATIGPDTTEADLAAEIYYRGVKYGASKVSFDPIIASGANGSKPHARFTGDKLVPDTPLTFDMGMRLNGYCSDMTRTVFYKGCPERWEKIYNTVRAAKDAAFHAVKPGLTGKEIDAVARQVMIDQGLPETFNHGLGHGIGIEVHEAPRLAKTGEIVLQAGMCITDEPGYYIDGVGGMRIEDIFVVRAGGAENLNTLDTELHVVG
jgi:Xaa-Pro aminopeptidase